MKCTGRESGRAACGELGGPLWSRGRGPPGLRGRPPCGPPARLSMGKGGPASGWRARRTGCVIGSLEPAAPALAGGTQSKSVQPRQCQGREQTHGSCSAPAGRASVPARLPPVPARPPPTPMFPACEGSFHLMSVGRSLCTEHRAGRFQAVLNYRALLGTIPIL